MPMGKAMNWMDQGGSSRCDFHDNHNVRQREYQGKSLPISLIQIVAGSLKTPDNIILRIIKKADTTANDRAVANYSKWCQCGFSTLALFVIKLPHVRRDAASQKR